MEIEDIGKKIKELREEQGLTIRELADKTGVIYVNISKLENGKYNAGIPILNKLLDALDAELKIEKR